MILRPSEILYSQNSINNQFGARSQYGVKFIGETLDDIVEGRCNVLEIPRITVVNIGGRWVTADNRRLWVFRHLERLGVLDNITVITKGSLPSGRLTAIDGGGQTVRVRGSPEGNWHQRTDDDYNLWRRRHRKVLPDNNITGSDIVAGGLIVLGAYLLTKLFGQ